MSAIFCRHAQTVYNDLDIFQGLSDSPLTSQGIKKSKKLNQFLKCNYNIKTFFISDLKRVKETYKIVSEGINADLVVDTRLREICFGYWETKKRVDVDPIILKERAKNRYNFVHPGEYNNVEGQSFSSIYHIVVNFIMDIKNKGFLEESIDCCCITHQGVLINVARFCLDLALDDMNKLRIKNNTIIIVSESSSQKFQVKFVDI